MSGDLTAAAFEEARRLEDSWVGPEHHLLALLAMPSVATEVLNGLGIDHERVAADCAAREFRPNGKPTYDPEHGSRLNPAGYQLAGRAVGLAFAWGRSRPTAEDWLVALLYDAGGIASLFHVLGVTPDAPLDGLRARGAQVPAVEPPRYRPWRGEAEVIVTPEDLGPVLRLLGERHPPGSEWRWGFNWITGEPRRAIVIAEEGIDLAGIVDECRAAASSE